jgi:hypothetical protein
MFNALSKKSRMSARVVLLIAETAQAGYRKAYMNPLLWKREHQRALLLASGIGALLGLIHGVGSSSPIWGFHDCRSLIGWLLHPVCSEFEHDWFPLLGWPLLGGVVGTTIIYIWRLMQS